MGRAVGGLIREGLPLSGLISGWHAYAAARRHAYGRCDLLPAVISGCERHDVAVLNAGRGQRFVVEQLAAAGPVLELVAHQLVVRAVSRQVHLLDQDGDHPIHRGVGRQLDQLLLVARGVPNFDRDVADIGPNLEGWLPTLLIVANRHVKG